jgi:hemerythrin
MWIAKSVSKQQLRKHVTTQTTIGETMMDYINTWLHSNIKSNDEKLLNYANEAYINSVCVRARVYSGITIFQLMV